MPTLGSRMRERLRPGTGIEHWPSCIKHPLRSTKIVSLTYPDAHQNDRVSPYRRTVRFTYLKRADHSGANRNAIPAPTDVLGFTPGDDRKLASWDQVVRLFQAARQASDRLKFEELGKSTMGKPFVMATISSPENLARLDEYRKIQEQLADPRKLGSPGSS